MRARLGSWLRSLLGRERFEDDLDEEVRFHLAERADDLVRQGLLRADAERRARLEFGAPATAKEGVREAHGLWWADELLRNVRYAVRVLRKSPAFTLSAVLTLGLCIGANAAIFSVVDAVMLRPLPYPEPDRLMRVATLWQSSNGTSTNTAQDGRSWEHIRDHLTLGERAVYSGWSSGVNLTVHGQTARRVARQRVGTGFFAVLGVRPVYGREFLADEDRPDGPAVAMLADPLARELFGDPASALGQPIDLQGAAHTIVGVMPAGFRTSGLVDVWTPLVPATTGEGEGTNYAVILRLPDGTSRPPSGTSRRRPPSGTSRRRAGGEAQAATVGAAHYAERGLGDGVSAHFTLIPLQRAMTTGVRQPLLVLWVAVGLVLLIGCVNVASLLLARARWRQREVAVRAALGGGRAAVLRQMLTESLVLAAAGGTVGLGFGVLAIEGLNRLALDGLGVWQTVALDGRVLVATTGLAIGTVLLFGLLPAVQASRVHLTGSLGSRGVVGAGAAASGSGGRVSRRALVVAEVALGVVLLVSAGLLIRTFSHLRGLEPGFAPAGVASARTSLDDARYAEAADVQRLFRDGVARMRAIPGVDEAAAGLNVPYERPLNLGFRFPGAENGSLASVSYVTPRYFETLGIPIRAGRTLDERDTGEAVAVVAVNEAFRKAHFPEASPLGERVQLSGAEREIVGVVGDVQHVSSWGEFGPLDAIPMIYVPVEQVSDGFLSLVHTWFSPAWVVRGARPPAELTAAMQSALASVDAQLPMFALQSMEEVMAAAWELERTQALLLGALSLLALLLAAVGIYGLVANSVVERRREVGIRMALGSTIGRTVRLFAAQGLSPAIVGVIVGIGLAFGAARLIRHLLWGVDAADPWTFAGVAALLLVTAAAASIVPTARIARIAPTESLRDD